MIFLCDFFLFLFFILLLILLVSLCFWLYFFYVSLVLFCWSSYTSKGHGDTDISAITPLPWCIEIGNILQKGFEPVVSSNMGSIWNWLMNSSQKVDERGMKTWFILLICSSLHWLMYSLTYYHEIFKFHLQSQYVLTQYEI